MTEKRPNDRNNNKPKRANNKGGKSFFETALGAVTGFFNAAGNVFMSGYKKYDAFIRRIFKLEPLDEEHLSHRERDEKDIADSKLDELHGLTRIRRESRLDDEEVTSFEAGETQRFEAVPDYLREKAYDGPAPLADLERDRHEPQDEGHHLNIFKKRQRPRSFFTSVLLGIVKIALALMLIGASSGIGIIQGIANAYVDTTPELDLTKIENQDESSFIYDGNGNLVTSFIGLENRISASVDEIPDMLKWAFVAVEDERFYTHNGIDLKRIFGAFFNNLRTDSTQGGSTITTQLIKLRILSSEQTYKRKIQEAYLALELEKKYTKDEILTSYMNTINLGSGNYGVKAAARDYFGKELSELTIRECAMLAGAANSSYLYNPRINYYSETRKDPDRTNDRTDWVLYNMYKNGYISQSEYEASVAEQVVVIEESARQQMYDMPYFLEYAIDDVVEHFIRQRNLDNNATNRNMIENELRTSGYHIYTTVDPVVQQTVEDSLYNWDRYPRTRYESDSSVMVQNTDGTSQELSQPQSAAVVYDYHTGQLKAIVGGRQEPQVKKALNRAVDSNMPVGSSIKPLAVYGPALNAGVSPSDVVYDLPLAVDGWITSDPEKAYPDNYGGTFTGIVTVREALYRSINNAAARILMDEVGLDESYRTLETLGISSSSINKDGSGLALGTSGISVMEMAVAYGAIGNSGVYIEPIAFTKVVDSDGNVLLDATETQIKRTVFSESANWLLLDMMTDVVERGTGTKAQIDGITVAGKTGTNSDYRGVFFSGITPYYSAALWIGHDNYKPLYRSANGGADAAPLWQAFMSEIHDELNLTDKSIMSQSPESLGLVKVETCAASGLLATDACRNSEEGTVTDWMLAENVPTEECDLHQEFRICLTTGLIETEYCKYGSQTDPHSYLLFPADSEVNTLTDEEFTQYFPNALRNLPEDLTQFVYTNELYSHLFCNVHTAEWHENYVKISNMVQLSQELISQVEDILINYSEAISDEVKILSEGYIEELENAIDLQDLESMSEVYVELSALKTQYLDPVVTGSGSGTEPSPTPAPEG